MKHIVIFSKIWSDKVNLNNILKEKQPIVHFPKELNENYFLGSIYGYFHAQSNECNVITYGSNLKKELQYLGEITDNEDRKGFDSKLFGLRKENHIDFYISNIKCQNKPYQLKLDNFSRNLGILETNEMLDKAVIISGLGSVGSLVALELARSGVGNFLLIDNDTITYQNICRHQCGIKDVGKYKVSAISERILDINPCANIINYTDILENIPESVFKDIIQPDSIIVGCADNRESDQYANKISVHFNIPFVSIGFWERAFAGEIFYSIPAKTPCYSCVFDSLENISHRISKNRRFYTNEEDLSNVNFEPGISVDINFITTISIKLILDLLNIKSKKYTIRLLNYLSQFTLICNNDNPAVGKEKSEIFSHPLQITRSIRVDFNESCSICNLLRGEYDNSN